MSEKYEFKGSAYVRPLGRGVCLESESGGQDHLEDWIVRMLGHRYSCAHGTNIRGFRITIEFDEAVRA